MFSISFAIVLIVFLFLNAESAKLRCPESVTVAADKYSASATVSWDSYDFHFLSSHPQIELYQVAPIHGAAATVRRAFTGGAHYIEYRAVDASGDVATCSFTVTVAVIRCPVQSHPQNGRLTCSHANLYGSRCAVSCGPGYTRAWDSITECTRTGEWSHDLSYCRASTCSEPGTPLYGSRNCSSIVHTLGSFCSFSCGRGFQLLGSDITHCQPSQNSTSWSHPTPICQEIIPPRIESCPSYVIQVSSTGSEAVVHKPPVRFRTFSNQEAPQKCSHFQNDSSQILPVGLHTVTCVAHDPAFGEHVTSKCDFIIRVKENSCRPLPQPLNGFLLCSRVTTGGYVENIFGEITICRVFCDTGYALPRSTDLHSSVTFSCGPSGLWQPTNFVPGCVAPSRPHEIKLPVDVLFTASNCTDERYLAALRIKFEGVLSAMARMHSTCALNPKDCIADDVTFSCRIRRSRTSQQLYKHRRIRRNAQNSYNQTTDSISPQGSSLDSVVTRSHLTNSSVLTRPSDSNETVKQNSELVDRNTSLYPSATQTIINGHVSEINDESQDVESSKQVGTDRTQSEDSRGHRRRPYTLVVRFNFATRLSLHGGDWPDEYHEAINRVFGLYDHLQDQVDNGNFVKSLQIRSMGLREVADSLSFSTVQTLCDLGYEFNSDILLCVPCGPGTYFDGSQGQCLRCPDGTSQPEPGQFFCH